MTELIDDIEDFSYVDYAVMSVLAIKDKPMTKSLIMRECIKRYGDLIEHGPYLYGEYSDDVDESIESLFHIGILGHSKRVEGDNRIIMTEYGHALFDRFLHDPVEDDDLLVMKEEILGGAFE